MPVGRSNMLDMVVVPGMESGKAVEGFFTIR
jgi:hypothetical protein